MEQKQKQKKKNPLILIAAGFFALVFGFSGFMLIRELVQAKSEADAFEALSSNRPRREARTTPKPGAQNSGTDTIVITNDDGSTTVLPGVPDPASPDAEPVDQPTEENADRSAIVEENRKLHEQNPDFFAWITIPGTNIDYPVMYTPRRPNYYISHDFNKQEAATGVPYLDEECDPDGNYYLVYGHRPALKTMFYHLVDYKNQSFWETHQEIYFDTLNEERTYVVVAAVKARVLEQGSEGFRYYNYKSLDTEAKFNEYMRQVREMQLYDTGIDVSFGDEILVLSTCYKYISTGRFFVVAKRIY
ncbi:MAG: class B sortase [Clostridia bacterium]|nr:class B sortase [Clostridia bacterium]